MQLMYQLSITAAGKSIDLSTAYFVPDELTTRALTDALKRGVKIRIITPGEIIDTDTVRAASRGSWGPLCSRPGRRSTSTSPPCTTARS